MRYICRDYHSDFKTIADFRKRFLKDIEDVFKQILLIAHEMGQLKLGKISLDGSKIKANASRHKALSWEYANKLEKQIREDGKDHPGERGTNPEHLIVVNESECVLRIHLLQREA